MAECMTGEVDGGGERTRCGGDGLADGGSAGREVSLTAARSAHIVGQHPDMVGRLANVRATVEAPEAVTRDRTYPNREVHYRRPPGELRYVRVVVRYLPVPPDGTFVGEVITAHWIGMVEQRETHVWP